MQFFITGTDTEIGKTYFSAWLVRRWRAQGYHAAGIKPISCGGIGDAEALCAAVNNELSLDEVNPIRFRSPLAPAVAAQIDQSWINWNVLNASVAAARARFTHLAIEGIGGWLVPLDAEKMVREWAMEIGLPVIVVARAGLGTLNHTMLTVESIEGAGLPVAGIVLNAGLDELRAGDPLARSSNAAALAERTDRPIFVFDRETERAGVLPEWAA